MANVTKKDLMNNFLMPRPYAGNTRIVLDKFSEANSEDLNWEGGKKYRYRGFGRFKIKERKARHGPHPHTNTPVQVPAGYKPVFQASKELRKRINALLERTSWVYRSTTVVI